MCEWQWLLYMQPELSVALVLIFFFFFFSLIYSPYFISFVYITNKFKKIIDFFVFCWRKHCDNKLNKNWWKKWFRWKYILMEPFEHITFLSYTFTCKKVNFIPNIFNNWNTWHLCQLLFIFVKNKKFKKCLFVIVVLYTTCIVNTQRILY